MTIAIYSTIGCMGKENDDVALERDDGGKEHSKPAMPAVIGCAGG